MKLLAIDDNQDNLLTLSALLKTFLPEAQLITSQSAQDGIRRAGMEAPDSILLDIQMPGMDGFEATRRLKASPATQHIPVILVTAHRSDSACRVMGLECGADAFLSKPFDEAELVAQIRAMVRIKRSEDALRQERDSLEALVQRRTSQLSQANLELQENLERLVENEARYSRAVRGTSDGLWDWDLVSDDYYYSPRWKELLGFADDELANRPDSFFSRVHPDDLLHVQDSLNAHFLGQTPFDLELRLRTRGGEYLRVRCRGQAEWDGAGKPVRMSGAITDITERQLMEEQLRQAQKMEAIGQLAGGVAHDFNNVLTVIAGYANILKMDLTSESAQYGLADQIAAAAERAAQLTRGLLAFSRKQAMSQQRCDLGDIVRRVQQFLGRVIGEDIQLKTEILPEPLPVQVDLAQIEQVLINLAANARDAMPGGGAITIATGLRDGTGHGHGEAAGPRAVIIVADTGEGMDEDTSRRIFEPFFTTKEVGKGTGLGMAIVYGIVQQHKGNIRVSSKPGEGTVFTIELPLIEGADALEPALASQPLPRHGTETILVAEDDPSVRSLVDMVLSRHGYQVILAEDGEEVVQRFQTQQEGIELVLMDIIMPRKNGIEAYAEIKKIQPGAKVLFTSGYTADFIQSRGMQEGVELIMKPVQPMELLRKVREVLER
ncbi:response regulator [Geomonas subterranea]|uniref:histidine kinase n=1 Tax=Geomonas subterranea TaxID=2847989 RepID=A0ABX8LRV2_9BACT|nr:MULTISPECIES: response regulator [Geomonas]QXE92235.1 response regulator [Geomonas subterranea]QXM09665.1 response regulator [Geomonas subterranea]